MRSRMNDPSRPCRAGETLVTGPLWRMSCDASAMSAPCGNSRKDLTDPPDRHDAPCAAPPPVCHLRLRQGIPHDLHSGTETDASVFHLGLHRHRCRPRPWRLAWLAIDRHPFGHAVDLLHLLRPRRPRNLALLRQRHRECQQTQGHAPRMAARLPDLGHPDRGLRDAHRLPAADRGDRRQYRPVAGRRPRLHPARGILAHHARGASSHRGLRRGIPHDGGPDLFLRRRKGRPLGALAGTQGGLHRHHPRGRGGGGPHRHPDLLEIPARC